MIRRGGDRRFNILILRSICFLFVFYLFGISRGLCMCNFIFVIFVNWCGFFFLVGCNEI